MYTLGENMLSLYLAVISNTIFCKNIFVSYVFNAGRLFRFEYVLSLYN